MSLPHSPVEIQHLLCDEMPVIYDLPSLVTTSNPRREIFYFDPMKHFVDINK